MPSNRDSKAALCILVVDCNTVLYLHHCSYLYSVWKAYTQAARTFMLCFEEQNWDTERWQIDNVILVEVDRRAATVCCTGVMTISIIGTIIKVTVSVVSAAHRDAWHGQVAVPLQLTFSSRKHHGRVPIAARLQAVLGPLSIRTELYQAFSKG